MPAPDQTPRVAAAEQAGDAFLQRLQQETPVAASEIPEFDEFRAALSDDARAAFDKEWENEISYNPGPQTWEMALAIRDDGAALIGGRERNALRRHIASLCVDEGYPITGPGNHDRYEFGASIAGPEALLAEADQLAKLYSRSSRLEEMLRTRHKPGGLDGEVSQPPSVLDDDRMGRKAPRPARSARQRPSTVCLLAEHDRRHVL
ncbi:hypothetical protein GCM10009733_006930 [Nonomuraea maheshkhaliensis]|uniref:DUF222 domain-containing protein n=1 Tax=Nonomuraea maheshkhaliensis TaxID=419590 RepID=A0ABP4QKS8_9ACTN